MDTVCKLWSITHFFKAKFAKVSMKETNKIMHFCFYVCMPHHFGSKGVARHVLAMRRMHCTTSILSCPRHAALRHHAIAAHDSGTEEGTEAPENADGAATERAARARQGSLLALPPFASSGLIGASLFAALGI